MNLTSAKINAAAWLCVALCAAPVFAADPPAPLPAEPDVAQLQSALAAHRTTVSAVAQHYMQRINDIDVHGPALHSIIQVNPDAAKLAGALDAATDRSGILFGVPVVLKDNIETADGLLTTAGSLALVASKPPRDAFIVRKLRASGALLLAKTNLSEWANFRSSRSTFGLERPRRPHAQSLRHQPQCLRVQFRFRCGRRRGPDRAGGGQRDRWLDRVPLEFQWPGRHQAHGRTGLAFRNHSDQCQAGHRRSHGAQCYRRGRAADCDGRVRSG